MGTPASESRCDRCSTVFVAFRRGIPCPGCGLPANGTSDVVDAALRTYRENLAAFGSPVPPSIRVQGLRDDYLYRGLFFLKALDARGPRETEDQVVERMLAVPDGRTSAGWRSHFADFYREILRARRRSERAK